MFELAVKVITIIVSGRTWKFKYHSGIVLHRISMVRHLRGIDIWKHVIHITVWYSWMFRLLNRKKRGANQLCRLYRCLTTQFCYYISIDHSVCVRYKQFCFPFFPSILFTIARVPIKFTFPSLNISMTQFVLLATRSKSVFRAKNNSDLFRFTNIFDTKMMNRFRICAFFSLFFVEFF